MMAQDIRDLFKNDKSIPKGTLPQGHADRFAERLNALHNGNTNTTVSINSTNYRFYWMKIAAIFIVILSVGTLGYKQLSISNPDTPVVTLDKANPTEVNSSTVVPVFLSEVSPQFKEVEDYYLASINMELAQLKVNDENKDLIDTFMAQLAELDEEYAQLNRELKEAGINEQTVNTLIANLQLRLELLFKLKSKLNQLKQSQNETNKQSQA